jgi:hypothetical protein
VNKDSQRIMGLVAFKAVKYMGDRQQLADLRRGDPVIARAGILEDIRIGHFLRPGEQPGSIVLRQFGSADEVEVSSAVVYCLDMLDRYDLLEGSHRLFYERLKVALDHPLYRASLQLVDLFFDGKGWAKVSVERIRDGSAKSFSVTVHPLPDDQELAYQLSALLL